MAIYGVNDEINRRIQDDQDVRNIQHEIRRHSLRSVLLAFVDEQRGLERLPRVEYQRANVAKCEYNCHHDDHPRRLTLLLLIILASSILRQCVSDAIGGRNSSQNLHVQNGDEREGNNEMN
jgi:hypothetical protein